MRKYFGVLAALISFGVILGLVFPVLAATNGNDNEICGDKTEFILHASKDQHNAGTVWVWNDSDHLYLEFASASGWTLDDTKVDVSTERPGGRGAPGQYEYHEPEEHSSTASLFKIALSSDWDTIYIRAKADAIEENGGDVDSESAFAGDYQAKSQQVV